MNKLCRGQIFIFSFYFRKGADAKVPDSSSNNALRKLSAIGDEEEREKRKEAKGFALTTCSVIEWEMGLLRQVNRAKWELAPWGDGCQKC